jgi:hypothetical protein
MFFIVTIKNFKILYQIQTQDTVPVSVPTVTGNDTKKNKVKNTVPVRVPVVTGTFTARTR